MNISTRRVLLFLTVSLSLTSFAQKPAPRKTPPRTAATKRSSWIVKPEWVRAGENFLASDALEGRGSGTRDEWIAAEFVAAQFESFGLKAAAADKSFIEKVELVKPKLDGKAQITTGTIALNEGPDFYLLTASGESASGKLVKLATTDVGKKQVGPGSAVLLTDGSDDPRVVFQAAQRLRGSASIVLVQDSAAMKQV